MVSDTLGGVEGKATVYKGYSPRWSRRIGVICEYFMLVVCCSILSIDSRNASNKGKWVVRRLENSHNCTPRNHYTSHCQNTNRLSCLNPALSPKYRCSSALMMSSWLRSVHSRSLSVLMTRRHEASDYDPKTAEWRTACQNPPAVLELGRLVSAWAEVVVYSWDCWAGDTNKS